MWSKDFYQAMESVLQSKRMCVKICLLYMQSTVYPESRVRWWRDVLLLCNIDCVDRRFQWDWLTMKVVWNSHKNGNAHNTHTHRGKDRQSDIDQPTDRPASSAVRPTETDNVIFFPFRLLRSLLFHYLLLSMCLLLLLLLLYAHRSQGVWRAQFVTMPSSFEWMVHMNRGIIVNCFESYIWICFEVFDNIPTWCGCSCSSDDGGGVHDTYDINGKDANTQAAVCRNVDANSNNNNNIQAQREWDVK